MQIKKQFLKDLRREKFIENRSDDNSKTIFRRYEKYMETTKPVLNFYSQKSKF